MREEDYARRYFGTMGLGTNDKDKQKKDKGQLGL